MKRNYNRTPDGIWHHIKWKSKRQRNHIPVSITKNEFIKWYNNSPRVCTYCGLPWETLRTIKDRKNCKVTRLTVDRMDNTKGYEKDNLCLACMRCNDMKGNFFSYEQMKRIGLIIREVWQERSKL
jgi:5-methylcytosine-specific restriction endonuclease McrA